MIALGGRHGGAGQPTLRGDLLIVLSLMIALVWILMNKQLLERHSPVVVTAYGLVAGTAMLTAIVPLVYGAPPFAAVSAKAWWALAGSGVLCTATHDAAVELGPDAGAGVAGRRAVEHGAAHRLAAGRAGAGRDAGTKRVAGRRPDPGRGGRVDDPLQDDRERDGETL